MSEADIIARYFSGLGLPRADVRLGIGDDAAVLAVPAGMELVATTDSLVAGTHFTPASSARSLGHKALAVNLSDCAAMGARPTWALLSLVLPEIDEQWLADFSAGFGALARQHSVALVGGNLAHGPLCITVQLLGLVRAGTAVRRSGATVGDALCLTGTVGDAAAGLRQRLGTLRNPGEAIGCERFDRPEPRVELGMALPGLASSCIDISDGVLADLRRLALGSHCGIHLQIDALPLSAAVRAALGEQAWQLALQGGEDYELAITVPPDKLEALRRAATAANTPLTVVGSVIDKAGVHCVLQGRELPVDEPGFDHFAAS